ncbi:unnamed protein product, partial [Didymodactylos carnosus]
MRQLLPDFTERWSKTASIERQPYVPEKPSDSVLNGDSTDIVKIFCSI